GSSSRIPRGIPPDAELPPAPEPAIELDPVWATTPFETPPATPSPDSPEKIDVSTDLPPLRHAASDNTPTVISRLPGRPMPTEDVLASVRGRRLAHFELIAPVGVGGMAAVIKARDLQLDRTVALKILPPDMA